MPGQEARGTEQTNSHPALQNTCSKLDLHRFTMLGVERVSTRKGKTLVRGSHCKIPPSAVTATKCIHWRTSAVLSYWIHCQGRTRNHFGSQGHRRAHRARAVLPDKGTLACPMTSTALAETTAIPLRLQQHHEELRITPLSWLFCDLHFESGMERHGRRMFHLLNLRHKESKTHFSLKF